MKKKISKMPVKYLKFLTNVKNQIQRAQIKAAIYVNRELIALYWNIGKQILQLQKQEGWGKSIVEQLSKDLRRGFPSLKGFSPRNLWEMRSFYDVYKNAVNLQQLVAEIPWGHNLALIHKIKHNPERLWYIRKTIEHGWSRNVLIHQIESTAYHRSGKAITNFRKTLPPMQSDLAHQIIKDPYKFDFLTIEDTRREKDMKCAIYRFGWDAWTRTRNK